VHLCVLLKCACVLMTCSFQTSAIARPTSATTDDAVNCTMRSRRRHRTNGRTYPYSAGGRCQR
jgi:hypothetical protein